ncbi:heat shock factor protein isoform X4 [Palaemon carinicauda]|uniref:heat shock factor protein isoform X4 n=1 Tax=Palaemon carinicauda TaxID=392227 RepID=UPI0035B5D6E2
MHAIEGTSNVPAFLTKLWRLVDDRQTDDLICWTENGRSFIIQNQARFSRELLPQYYKHNNMASFVRQLNMYGFHKVTSADSGGLRVEKDEMEFAHPAFQQGREDLIENIKRKQQRRLASDGMDLSQIPTSRLGVEDNKKMGKLLNDVRDMKRDHDTMSTKLLSLKRENEALWREYASMRQKFSKQQQIIEKLIHFLVAMVKSPSKPIIPKRKFGHLALEGVDDAASINAIPQLAQNIELLDGLASSTMGGAQIHEVTDLIDSNDPSVIPEIFSPDSGNPGLEMEEIPISESEMTVSSAGQDINEPSTILLVDGEPFIDNYASHPSTSIPIRATSIRSPSGSSLIPETQNSKISAFNKLLDEEPLSPELLNTVDPSDVTQSFKYAVSPVSNVTPSPTIITTSSTGTRVISAPGKAPGSGKSIQKSQGRGKLKTIKTSSGASAFQPSVSTAQQSSLSVVAQPSRSSITQPSVYNKNDIQTHMDEMQNSIESLQEIIATGGFNVDPSMLLSMFGSDVTLPELDSMGTSTGNEVSLYNPSLLDLADMADDPEDDPMKFLNRSSVASTSSASAAVSPSSFCSPAKSKLGSSNVPLAVSIKEEKVCDELSTPKILSPVQSPIYRGKKRRN